MDGCVSLLLLLLFCPALLTHGARTEESTFRKSIARTKPTPSAVEDTVFTPGTSPLDELGTKVEAHGGCLVHHAGRFYWFGESRKLPAAGDWLSEGISLYSSPDLAHWTSHGLVLRGSDIHVPGRNPPFRLERPKVVLCPLTGRWVLYLHLDLPNFWMSSVGVAASPSLQGPYTFLHALKPDGLDSFDMTLFQDDDGTAYLVRSVANRFTGISALTPDYLNTTSGGLLSRAPQMEGQALFKHRGGYYLMGSHLTGWSPNPLMLFQAQLADPTPREGAAKLEGATWRAVPAPTSGPGAPTTYNSQPAYVATIKLPDNQDFLLYMGDRWNYWGPGSLDAASYVWLPLLPTPPAARDAPLLPTPPEARDAPLLPTPPATLEAPFGKLYAAAGTPRPFQMPFRPSWSIRDYLPAATVV